jgi:hypothetical protein
VSQWVRSDRFTAPAQCPLLIQERPPRCVALSDATSQEQACFAVGQVQTLLSMCAPNILTSLCEEVDWHARIAD